jgi:hypothetical protein
MFEGEVRKGYSGDLAIDVFQILDGPCPYKATVVPIVYPTIEMTNCNFDTDICGWAYALAENFAWIRNTGSTATPNTGPPYDHTGGGKLMKSLRNSDCSVVDAP